MIGASMDAGCGKLYKLLTGVGADKGGDAKHFARQMKRWAADDRMLGSIAHCAFDAASESSAGILTAMEQPGAARIMVIEDDPDLMRLLSHTLKSAGFNVIQAYGGEDALRKVKAQKPDLVLTDLAMPKMSGVEVIHQIKSDPETAGIPCVAVTAHMWDHIAQSAGQVGCDSFIAKPFNSVRLLQEVTKYVAVPGKLPSRAAAGA
jgi:CheY-like chemotaxis protein